MRKILCVMLASLFILNTGIASTLSNVKAKEALASKFEQMRMMEDADAKRAELKEVLNTIRTKVEVTDEVLAAKVDEYLELESGVAAADLNTFIDFIEDETEQAGHVFLLAFLFAFFFLHGDAGFVIVF